jgi:hypothetical protein
MIKRITVNLCLFSLSLIGFKANAQDLTPPYGVDVSLYVDKVRIAYYDCSTDETRFQVSKSLLNLFWIKYCDLPSGTGTASSPVYQSFYKHNPVSLCKFRIRAEKENGLFDKKGSWAYDNSPNCYLPDLTVSNITKNKSTAYPGNTVNLTCSVVNLKSYSSPASKLYYYLSQTSGGDTYYLGSDDVSALSGNGSSSESITITIPRSLTPAGTYYLVFKADATNIIPESSGSNNTVSVPIKIVGSPRISISCHIWPFQVTAGDPYYFDYTFRNTGTMASNSFSTTYGTCPALGIGQSWSGTHTFWSNQYDSGIQWEHISGGGTSCSSMVTINPKTNIKSAPIIENEISKDGILIYPNPCDGVFTISLKKDTYQYAKVFGTDSKLLFEENINGRTKLDMDITNAPKGIYILHLQSHEGIETQKIIIQ